MARTTPENRFKQLVEAATRVFISAGYRRTQIADVAREAGVAKGTVYLYVESKRALFAAALRHADGEAPGVSDLALPLSAPAPGELERELAERLGAESVPEPLARALAESSPGSLSLRAVRREFQEIVHALFATSSRHRTAIELLDRCGRDHPELSRIFYRGGRSVQLDALTRYLESRVRSGAIRVLPETSVAARFVIEAVATWAVHIHWDPSPEPIDPQDAEATLVRVVVGGLIRR